jgi:hypothetical protein
VSEGQTFTGAKTERGFMGDLPKYFLHGILYSIIAAVASMILGVITVALSGAIAGVSAAIGQLFGWILVIVLLIGLIFVSFLVVGVINTYLSATFWKVRSPMNWRSLVGHGGALAILLLVFGLPAFAIDFLFPNLDQITFLVVVIPRVIIYSLVYGYTGRFVALGFSDVPSASKVIPVPAGLLATCPACGVDTLCRMSKYDEMKVISCTSCGLPFEVAAPE